MTPSRKTVLILGYGEMGHAMQVLLKDRHDLHIWDKFPSPGMKSVVLEDAAPQADFAVFCLPVKPHREVAETIVPLLKPGCICISIAKGLDESGQTAAQIFAGVLGAENSDFALLYGPMIAEELRAGLYGFAQLACSSENTCSRVQGLFSGSALLIAPCDDVTGISWAVILKNVYAMVFGMADGLVLGDNMRGFLMATSLSELDAIVRVMGGTAGSPYGLAGLGDLVTTATSMQSHHHELGRSLACGETEDVTGEGAHTLAMVEQHSLFEWRDYPLFSLIKRLLAQPQSIEREILAFARDSQSVRLFAE